MPYMPVFQWRLKKKVLELLAIDRICRLADIGSKDISFDVLSVGARSHPDKNVKEMVKTYYIQIKYIDPRVWGVNPLNIIGKYEVYEGESFSWLEEEVAKRICRIKGAPARKRDQDNA